MLVEILTGATTAFAGLGWFFQWMNTRRADSHKAEAEARAAKAEAEAKEAQTRADDWHLQREQMEFLQEQLKEKEERFAEQTGILRKLQDEVYEEKELRHKSELELAMRRCIRDDCPFRQPPNANTPPDDPGHNPEWLNNARRSRQWYPEDGHLTNPEK